MALFDKITFKKIELSDLEYIYPYFLSQTYKTCDFTIGGIYMWRKYFNYEYCICNEKVLFIKGNDVITRLKNGYAIPLGCNDYVHIIAKLYENNNKKTLYLNGVPEGAVELITSKFDCVVTKLDNWTEYIYDASSLATLSGIKYKKKRNHVNQFIKKYPNHYYEEINIENIKDVIEFMNNRIKNAIYDSEISRIEEQSVMDIIDNYQIFKFDGIILYVDSKIISFTIGEVLKDVLYTHIEKADINYMGAYQAINYYFANYILKKYDGIKYINREDDAGDLGIRQAKLSYNPVILLNKYQIAIKNIKEE